MCCTVRLKKSEKSEKSDAVGIFIIYNNVIIISLYIWKVLELDCLKKSKYSKEVYSNNLF